MVSKGEMWVFDSSCITQPQSQIATESKAQIESHLGPGFFRVPSGFICNTLYLIYVNHCLTFAHFGGWLAASFTEIQATVFQ